MGADTRLLAARAVYARLRSSLMIYEDRRPDRVRSTGVAAVLAGSLRGVSPGIAEPENTKSCRSAGIHAGRPASAATGYENHSRRTARASR